MFQYTGEYKKHISSGLDKMNYYTFTPTPLSDGLPLPVDDELFASLTTAHKLLGVIEGIIKFSPYSNAIRELFCLKESCYSLLVDNQDGISFYDTLKARALRQENPYYVNNLVTAQKYSYEKSVSNSELTKICGLITYGIESPQVVEIRKKQICFRRVLTNLKIYTPTAPEDILPAIQDLTKFINMDNHTDILIKTALAHYQFEMIHPFETGNGTVGRILIQMMLLNAQYQAAPYLCISEFLYRNKEEYFDKLSAAQAGNGYSYWIKFFINAICQTAERSIDQIGKFTEITVEDEMRLAALSKSSKYVMLVYDYFKHHLISEIKPIADVVGISYNTAAKVVGLLVDADILEPENEQARHKMYLHKAMDILNSK